MPGNGLRPITYQQVREAAAYLNCSLDEAAAALERDASQCQYWINELYQVAYRPLAAEHAHLNIRRRDGKPIFRDWRHFQQIKNELLGAECEAVELYPAESRKVDTSNKYHLWGSTNPAYRFPFGMVDRDVSNIQSSVPGHRQRMGA